MTKTPETPAGAKTWKEEVFALFGTLRDALIRKITAPRPRGPLPYALVVFAVFVGLLAFFYRDVLSEPFRKGVATVNGEKITQREFERVFSRHMETFGQGSAFDEDEIEGLKHEILDDLIARRIMLQQARKLHITVSDRELAGRIEEIKKDYESGESFYGAFREGKMDYTTWAEELKKRLILEKLIQSEVNARVEVSDDEARRYHAANRRGYVTDEGVHLAQIIVTEGAEREKALERLKNGEDFDKVARDVSSGPERERGGDIGYFSRGMLPEVVEKEVFALPVGRTSRVIKSPYGYHIFKVLKRERKGTGRFEDVRERVIQDLREEKEETAFLDWLETLRASSVVEIDEEAMGRIRLE